MREYLQGDVEPSGHAIIDDDKTMLEARVAKNGTGLSHVEIPRSMATRVISNVLVDGGATPGELRVRSNFMVRLAQKLRDGAWWIGRRIDTLRPCGGAWKIARRESLLDATVLPRGIPISF